MPRPATSGVPSRPEKRAAPPWVFTHDAEQHYGYCAGTTAEGEERMETGRITEHHADVDGGYFFYLASGP
ncbi:MAG TPA: hypothetical protein VFE65_17950, partial [Pseudonocardia sp.]|nr:hypothetical protein [Pseudonocardia sp.]